MVAREMVSRRPGNRGSGCASGEWPTRRYFGSRARGDERPESDTDILIAIDPTAPVEVWEYAGIKAYIASLFEGPVDVLDRDGLKPYVKPAAALKWVGTLASGNPQRAATVSQTVRQRLRDPALAGQDGPLARRLFGRVSTNSDCRWLPPKPHVALTAPARLNSATAKWSSHPVGSCNRCKLRQVRTESG